MLSLQAIESLRILVGISDGFLVVYDLYTSRPLLQMAESKGCTLYAIHAPSKQVRSYAAASLPSQSSCLTL
jgi:hypothetical protein